MKPKKLLFASDFDHTLSQYPHGVRKETVEAIGKFREKGNIFGIITGRNFATASYILNDCGHFCDFFMCMTGAYAMDGSGKMIFEYNGDGAALYDIMKLLHKENPVYLSFSDRTFTYDFDVEKPLEDDEKAMELFRNRKNFTQINTKYDTVEKSTEIKNRLLELYGDKVNPQLNGSCLDIPPAGVSKAGAVRRMAEYFGVEIGNIFTAGDNNNDVPMLEAFYGYSVPHGTEAARGAAKKIFPAVEMMIEDAEKVTMS